MAKPTLLTCPHSSPLSPRYSVMAAIQPPTTACCPLCALVGRCSSLVETVVPSPHTPPTFDMVAPQSVPMKTCCCACALMGRHFTAGGDVARSSLSRAGGGRTGEAQQREPALRAAGQRAGVAARLLEAAARQRLRAAAVDDALHQQRAAALLHADLARRAGHAQAVDGSAGSAARAPGAVVAGGQRAPGAGAVLVSAAPAAAAAAARRRRGDRAGHGGGPVR